MAAAIAELTPPPYGGTEAEWREWAEAQSASRAMGLVCESAQHGRVRVRLTETNWPLNPNGAVHGGMVVAWADQCFGLVTSTTASPGDVPATATLSAEFLRPAIPPLVFEAKVDRTGRSLAFVCVDVYDKTDRLCAKVMGTMSNDGTSRFLDADGRPS